MTSEKIRVLGHKVIEDNKVSPALTYFELNLTEEELRSFVAIRYSTQEEVDKALKELMALLQGKQQEVKEQRSCEHIGTLMFGLNGEPYTKCIKCNTVLPNSEDKTQTEEEEKKNTEECRTCKFVDRELMLAERQKGCRMVANPIADCIDDAYKYYEKKQPIEEIDWERLKGIDITKKPTFNAYYDKRKTLEDRFDDLVDIVQSIDKRSKEVEGK
jgi:hypothetical protein